jgi:predicted nucleotidyltransferase
MFIWTCPCREQAVQILYNYSYIQALAGYDQRLARLIPGKAMETLTLLRKKKPEIEAIARKYGAHNVRVFGSVARGEDTPRSDVDILIDLKKGISLYEHIRLKNELQELLGRKVDVMTPAQVVPDLKRRIFAEARPL